MNNPPPKITSFGFTKGAKPAADLTLDARHLPNPATQPNLKLLTGKNPQVKTWLLQHPQTHQYIQQALQQIRDTNPQYVAVGCSAGQHRAVLIADQLAQKLGTTATHRELNKKQNTTQRGYGHTHQQARKRLIHNHKDGTPCQYCGQPMYRDKHKNWDGHTLEADHEHRQKDATNKRRNLPTRLLHKTCNALDGARAQWGLPHTPPQPPKPKPRPNRFQWKQ